MSATDKKPSKKTSTHAPFADAGFEVGGLSVDSAQDRIAITGSTDITRDKAGLKLATQLANYFQAAAQQLQADLDANTLPDKIAIDAPVEKDNPFP